mmetsp:Transcript_35941/g.94532  ORF Transcript_35941/g.94532 Transcript_35941/m.94532 type:complete len:206 (+) Transcript_35941:556-1173(+)
MVADDTPAMVARNPWRRVDFLPLLPASQGLRGCTVDSAAATCSGGFGLGAARLLRGRPLPARTVDHAHSRARVSTDVRRRGVARMCGPADAAALAFVLAKVIRDVRHRRGARAWSARPHALRHCLQRAVYPATHTAAAGTGRHHRWRRRSQRGQHRGTRSRRECRIVRVLRMEPVLLHRHLRRSIPRQFHVVRRAARHVFRARRK